MTETATASPARAASDSPYPPISDYALLSDCHSAALVSRDGSIDWCCFHRFDARPVFARILDWNKGGYFRIGPTSPGQAKRRYIPGTNVLETTFETAGGVLVLTDALVVSDRPGFGTAGEPGHPHHQLVRRVRCESGEVHLRFDFRPRFDYGTTEPRVDLHGDDLALAYGGADGLILQSELPVRKIGRADCGCETTLRSGDDAIVAVTHVAPEKLKPERVGREVFLERLDKTVEFWTDWSGRCRYEGPYREYVVRSALVLKGLTNAPTGAIVAAPTTSLPEEIGGERNWDYRYAWLRDSAFTLYALFNLGYTEEAHHFMDWLRRTAAGRASELQVFYGVGGEHMLPEIEIRGLDGYRGSRPVRVGNAAVNQLQLDLYGEVLDTAWLAVRRGRELDGPFWDFLCEVADVIVARWREPDEGIWEVRSGRQHFVYSKVMSWVGLDRAVKLAESLGREPREIWAKTRDEIRNVVLERGVDPDTGAFVQSFGSDALDAANLRIPLVHFLPGDDDRVRATALRTEAELAGNGLVYRYLQTDDGLRGSEGTFLICSFWLVDNLILIGERERAERLFERLCGLANDVGLLSEQCDEVTGELLGNFPQAFSHVGLINAAAALATREPTDTADGRHTSK